MTVLDGSGIPGFGLGESLGEALGDVLEDVLGDGSGAAPGDRAGWGGEPGGPGTGPGGHRRLGRLPLTVLCVGAVAATAVAVSRRRR
ncbi:hypothetical protein OK074_3271 [Actinobacteria bacterium OK074]|nr:hypothetical protein OK074_3271 [Actinobacteria bacterium OK074]